MTDQNADSGAQNAADSVRIVKDPEWDAVAHVERRRWRIDLPNGGRKFTRTRREAVEWCTEMGIQIDSSSCQYRSHVITVTPSTRQDGVPYFVTDIDGRLFGGAHIRRDRAIANAKAYVRRKFSQNRSA